MEWENVACVLPIIHTWDFLKYDGMIPLCMCVGFFFFRTQVQIETRNLGPILIVLRDWAWFTASNWADFKPDGAQSTNPTTHTC